MVAGATIQACSKAKQEKLTDNYVNNVLRAAGFTDSKRQIESGIQALLQNGDFEEDPVESGWRCDQCSLTRSTQSYSGDYSISVFGSR